MATASGTGTGSDTGTVKPKANISRVQPQAAPKKKKNRDPHDLNKHIKIKFYDVLGEPKDLQSVDCVWEFSEIMYDCFRSCIYKLMSFFCGACIAIYWGIEMVPFVYCHVWHLTPFNQCLKIILGSWCKTFWTICFRSLITPCTKSCAYFFIHCGDGLQRRAETPSIFPKSRPRPKPVKQEPPPEKVVVVNNVGAFNDYDKEKIARSVRRQLML